MPAMPLRAFSIGITTAVVISSGAAPGRRRLTLTVAGSAFGNKSTPRSRNEKIPSTTSDITSIVANTGRRTQSSESDIATPLTSLLFAPAGARSRLNPCAIREVVDVGNRDGRPRRDPLDDLDP